MFIKRRIDEVIERTKNKFPILAITGPRQSGKTTLLKQLFPEYRYISLEDPNTRQFAESDAIAFLDTYDRYVILDEVQRVPMLSSYQQNHVDNNDIMAPYILSGSHESHVLLSIAQTLARRVALFLLLPVDLSQEQHDALLADLYAEAAVKGAYPAI